MHARRKSLLAAGMALGLASGALLTANVANAATYLSTNLTASGASTNHDGQTLARAATDVVTVGNPGNQTSTAGVAIGTLQLSASSSAGDAITSYTATG